VTSEAQDEAALVERARRGDAAAFELLMRRHNQRVYRVVRSVLHEPQDVEDTMQQAYLSAFLHIEQFAGTSRWSTWVCRIAINEALAQLRRRGRSVSLAETDEETMTVGKTPQADPEQAAAGHELQAILEQAVDGLPEIYRTVVMLREIEGMTTAETAAVLDVQEEVVKTRLHRARVTLRASLEKKVGEALEETFTFGNERCDRVVAAVLARLTDR
jgi:RNA polymerase sigma-70 factor (ECF subfamily)